MSRRNVRLLVFPVEDRSLRVDVERAIERLPDDIADDLGRSAAQHDLRRWYRSLQIRERDPLGGYTEDPTRVWYVFRDGRIRNTDPGLDRLYRALASARATCHASEIAIAGAVSAARSAGYRAPAARTDGSPPAAEDAPGR